MQFIGARGIDGEQFTTNRIRSGKVGLSLQIYQILAHNLLFFVLFCFVLFFFLGVQCYPESGSLGSCLSELLMLESCELQSRQRLRLAEASLNVASVTRGTTAKSISFHPSAHNSMAVILFAELVTVTDGHFNIRYINPGVERLLGFAAEEILGKNMIELYRCEGSNNRYDINDAAQHVLTNKTREWEGSCFVRRRTGDSVPLYSRMIAVHSSKTEQVALI